MVSKSVSNRQFSIKHNIDEKTLRKIRKEEGYRIPVETLFEICDSRSLTLSDFFKLVGV